MLEASSGRFGGALIGDEISAKNGRQVQWEGRLGRLQTAVLRRLARGVLLGWRCLASERGRHDRAEYCGLVRFLRKMLRACFSAWFSVIRRLSRARRIGVQTLSKVLGGVRRDAFREWNEAVGERRGKMKEQALVMRGSRTRHMVTTLKARLASFPPSDHLLDTRTRIP